MVASFGFVLDDDVPFPVTLSDTSLRAAVVGLCRLYW